MKLRNISLSTRITVITMLIVAVGATVFLYFERVHDREVYIDQQSVNLEKNLQAGNLRLTQAIDNLRQDALFLSTIPAVGGIIRASMNGGHDARDGDSLAQWEGRLKTIYASFSASHPDCYLIRYIAVAGGGKEFVRVENLGGRMHITPPGKLAKRIGLGGFEDYMGLQQGQIGLSEFELGYDSGGAPKPTLRAIAPVFAPPGRLFGLIVVNMDVSRLLESAALGLPFGTQAYMTNSDGQYLLHPDSQRAFRRADGKNEITADFPFIKAMFDPQSAGYLSLRDLATATGKYATATRIHFDNGHPGRFLLLMYHIPDDVAAGQISSTHVTRVVAGFAVILLAGWIALFALRRVFYPLEQVAAAAGKIAAGDQDATLPKTGGGEIGSLTHALNAMLVKLREREKLLRESETRYRRLHESMMDAYVMVDMSGKLLEFNHAYLEMLGYSSDELRRINYADLMPDKWRQAEAQIIEQQVIPRGYSQVYEKEYIRKNGTVFPVELKTFLLRETDSQPRAMWAIVRDITARKQLETVLSRSEESLNRAQAVCQIGSWDLDIPANRLEWSAEIYRMFCIPQQASINLDTFVAAIHPDDREFVLNAWNEAMKGAPYDLEHRIVAGGLVRWVRERARIEFDPDGRPHIGFGTVQDITDRKLAEDALRASENRYRLLVDSSPVCIHEIDLEGRMLSMNRTGLDMLGVDDEAKIRGKPYLDAVSRQDAGRVGALLQDAIANGTPSYFEFVSAGESPIHFKSCFIPIKDANGKVLKLMGLTEDISEHKQFEEMRARMAISGRFNIAGETAAILTHEISQPLTACNNYLDVCLRRIDEKDWSRNKLKETLQLAYQQAARAGDIINRFKKQLRRPEMEYTPLDINVLIGDVTAFLSGEIKRHGISVHMDRPPLPQIMACREEIRQVLLSLCENAIEAMHSSPQRELHITTRAAESGHVIVGVRDTGIGVLPEKMKALFEPFQTSREGGLGLSLSICRSIIEKHGGRIWAEPQRESGAEFKFTLPIKAHHE